MSRSMTGTLGRTRRVAVVVAALGLAIPATGALAGCAEEVPEGGVVNEEGGEGGEGGEGEEED